MRWRILRRLGFLIVLLGIFVWQKERLWGGKTDKLLVPVPEAVSVAANFPADKPGQGKDNAKTKIEKLEKLLSLYTGTYGVFVEDLESRQSYGIREDEMFPAASQMKLPIMLAVYIEHEKGRLGMDESYVLQATDKIEGTTLATFPDGSIFTNRQLVELSARNSDSSAIGILWRKLGDDKVKESLLIAGMKKSSFDQDITSPREVGNFFGYLYRGVLLREEYKQELIGFLTGTIWEDRIPAGLPVGVRVAHKVGTEDGGYSDGGIIFGKKPFVLVVMSRDADFNEAPLAIAKVAQAVWGFEESI